MLFLSLNLSSPSLKQGWLLSVLLRCKVLPDVIPVQVLSWGPETLLVSVSHRLFFFTCHVVSMCLSMWKDKLHRPLLSMKQGRCPAWFFPLQILSIQSSRFWPISLVVLLCLLNASSLQYLNRGCTAEELRLVFEAVSCALR